MMNTVKIFKNNKSQVVQKKHALLGEEVNGKKSMIAWHLFLKMMICGLI